MEGGVGTRAVECDAICGIGMDAGRKRCEGAADGLGAAGGDNDAGSFGGDAGAAILVVAPV